MYKRAANSEGRNRLLRFIEIVERLVLPFPSNLQVVLLVKAIFFAFPF